MSDRRIFTYQTRLVLDAAQCSALDAYAKLHGQVERSLFAALRSGKSINDLKRDFQMRFGITARQFNAVRVGLEGKIAAIKERRPDLITESRARIAKAKKVIAKLATRCPGTNKLHQKKRRLATLGARLSAMQADQVSGTVRLCFGSRRLFRAQFDLDANGYATLDAWRADWKSSRSDQFFALGSQDETAGNQTCQAAVAEDGTLTLRLRLPDAMATLDKHLTMPNVRFAHGQAPVVAALQSSRRIATTTQRGTRTIKRVGSALSYRFQRDDKGWRVFVSVEATPVASVTHAELGAIGLDINADHLAQAETDRFGNLMHAQRIDLPLYGKTAEQAKALIGDACAAMAARARMAGKPVVIEKLDFQKKKAEIETTSPRQARMLSSFACNKVISGIKAACFRAGVEVIDVNPAYTSVIGAVMYAQQKGISVHQGAAYAIARRGLGLSERPTRRMAIVPSRHGGHVTFALPARNRAKHVWSFWSKIRTRLKAAHVAHIRSGAANAHPAPLRPSNPASCPTWISTAQLRGANRQQHCSADVLGDVPW